MMLMPHPQRVKTDTLFEYYAQLIDGSSVVERGEHALFKGDDKSQDETQA